MVGKTGKEAIKTGSCPGIGVWKRREWDEGLSIVTRRGLFLPAWPPM